MNNNDNFRIHVNLNGLQVPLDIARKDEAIYRDAEKIVKKFIDQFRNRYSAYSMEEVLTLVAFHIATGYTRLQAMETDTPLAEKIEELNSELKTLLDKEEHTLF